MRSPSRRWYASSSMWVIVPSSHSNWKIQRMTALSPLTNTGRTHFPASTHPRCRTPRWLERGRSLPRGQQIARAFRLSAPSHFQWLDWLNRSHKYAGVFVGPRALDATAPDQASTHAAANDRRALLADPWRSANRERGNPGDPYQGCRRHLPGDVGRQLGPGKLETSAGDLDHDLRGVHAKPPGSVPDRASRLEARSR